MIGKVEVAPGERRRFVTVNLSIDYLGAAKAGEWIESDVEVQKIGKNIAFCTGFLGAGGRRIVRASGEMQEIVETLLALARATQGGDGAMRRIGLREAVEEQVARWRALAAQRGLQLIEETDEDATAGALTLPAAPLASVLSNLVRNALHYTEAGSVRVAIGHADVRVIDTGPGIPEHDRDRLADRRTNAVPTVRALPQQVDTS